MRIFRRAPTDLLPKRSHRGIHRTVGWCFGALVAAITLVFSIGSVSPPCAQAAEPDAAAPPAEELAPAKRATAEDLAKIAAKEEAAKRQAGEKPDGPVEIRVWWGLGGGVAQAFEEIVSEFNDMQDEIVVRVQTLGGYGAVHSALEKGSRGDGPLADVAVIETHHVAGFAASRQIESLDRFFKDDPAFDADDLLPGVLTNLRFGGQLYGLPISRSTPVLYYNKDRFIAAGLDPDKPPETWEELRDMAKQLTSDDRAQYGISLDNSPWVFESLVWSHGGELFVNGKPVFAEDGAGPLQLWADMVHLERSARYNHGGVSAFANGDAAMVIESTANLRGLTESCQFDLGTAFVPHSQGFKSAVPTGGGAAVIPSKIPAQRQAAAWEFLKWMISTDSTADWSRATGYMPARESAHASLAADHFYESHPQFEVTIRQLKFAREAPELMRWDDFWKIIADSMGKVLKTNAPALGTLKAAEKASERLRAAKAP